jgi:23S rRNA (guanosine2251-2'-O)-methyltransferase
MKLLYKTGLKKFIKQEKKLYPMRRELIFFLYNVEYPVNVGSIFRIAEAANVQKIYLAGTTPDPTSPKIQKIAGQKITETKWERVGNIETTMNKIKTANYHISALEITDQSEPFFETNYPEKVCLVAGHEVHGVPNDVLKYCNNATYIPMYGKGKSLNVHVALAIVTFYLISDIK